MMLHERSQTPKNIYCVVPFIKSCIKCKLYSITGSRFLGVGEEGEKRPERGITKGSEDTLRIIDVLS